ADDSPEDERHEDARRYAGDRDYVVCRVVLHRNISAVGGTIDSGADTARGAPGPRRSTLLGRRGILDMRRFFIVLCSLIFTAATALAQPPPAQDGFVPAGSLPPTEQLPAAPLLIGAYAFFLRSEEHTSELQSLRH